MRYTRSTPFKGRLKTIWRISALFIATLLLVLGTPAFAAEGPEPLNPQIGMNLDAAAATAQNLLVGMRMPSAVIESAVGPETGPLQHQSFRSHALAFGLAVFLVYLVMASQFESLLHPVIVLFTIPMALIGAAWGFYAAGVTLNALAIIGVIMLAGIVVNNAIVLIDAIHQARMRATSERKAIVEASRMRLRPIVIGSVSTLLGLLPMAFGVGTDAAMERSMGVTVTGGIVVATFVTLVAVPVLHVALDRKKPAAQPSNRRPLGAMTRR
jgi:hydrophobic/amphiphilic exporter-1 (mainly G- bacteria), HAE1 family